MTALTIKIPSSIQKAMVEHAKSLAPIESCGYLAGKGDVEKFYPMTNIDHSPDHFTFDPKDQFAVLKDARREGLQLLAVYHSHPASPARLSQEDIRLFNDPQTVYIIVSLMPGVEDVKAFKVNKTGPEILVQSVTIELI